MTDTPLSIAEIEGLRPPDWYAETRYDLSTEAMKKLCDMAIATARREEAAPELAEGVEGLIGELENWAIDCRNSVARKDLLRRASDTLVAYDAALARQQAEVAALTSERDRARDRVQEIIGGSADIQRHRDAWRSYAYGDGPKPDDYLDGNRIDRGPTRIERLEANLASERAARERAEGALHLSTPVPCGENPVLPATRLGCGRPIHREPDVYRCVECGTPFHKECAQRHFGSHTTEATADALKRVVEEALTVFDGIQWGHHPVLPRCVCCWQEPDAGHAPHCRLDSTLTKLTAALTAAQGEGEAMQHIQNATDAGSDSNCSAPSAPAVQDELMPAAAELVREIEEAEMACSRSSIENGCADCGLHAGLANRVRDYLMKVGQGMEDLLDLLEESDNKHRDPNLANRDDFIVERGLWSEFVEWLSERGAAQGEGEAKPLPADPVYIYSGEHRR